MLTRQRRHSEAEMDTVDYNVGLNLWRIAFALLSHNNQREGITVLLLEIPRVLFQLQRVHHLFQQLSPGAGIAIVVGQGGKHEEVVSLG